MGSFRAAHKQTGSSSQLKMDLGFTTSDLDFVTKSNSCTRSGTPGNSWTHPIKTITLSEEVGSNQGDLEGNKSPIVGFTLKSAT